MNGGFGDASLSAGRVLETPQRPLVSCVIPTYNRRQLVVEAVASVIAQAYRPIEIIVVDDGSTDGSADVVAALMTEAIAAADDRGGPGLSGWVLRNPHSGMPGLCRNRGVAASTGRLIAFLDSDDFWQPHKLRLQVALHTQPGGPRWSHTRERWLRGAREVSQRGQNHRRSGTVFADALVKCMIGPSTVVLARDLWLEHGGFREDIDIAEDYELWLRIAVDEPIAYLDSALTTKRAGHGDQLSERYGQIELFRIKALQNLIDTGALGAPGSDAHRLAADVFAGKCRIYATGAAKRDRHAEATDFLALAAKYAQYSQ